MYKKKELKKVKKERSIFYMQCVLAITVPYPLQLTVLHRSNQFLYIL
jgi:hypothetical protein